MLKCSSFFQLIHLSMFARRPFSGSAKNNNLISPHVLSHLYFDYKWKWPIFQRHKEIDQTIPNGIF